MTMIETKMTDAEPTRREPDRAVKDDPCPSGSVVAFGVPAPCFPPSATLHCLPHSASTGYDLRNIGDGRALGKHNIV